MLRRDLLKAIAATGVSSPFLGGSLLGLGRKQDHSQSYELEVDRSIRDNLEKVVNFNNDFSSDVFIGDKRFALLKRVENRLTKVMRYSGYANFSLLSFDDVLKYARWRSSIGEFTEEEKNFFEEIFYENASYYGFLGKKVISNLTSVVNKRDTKKIPYSGHYLYNGEPLKVYHKIKKDMGKDVVLTSGIRSVMKQVHLFLMKVIAVDGNISRASRSLAPPGYSYHGVGDFDVGKRGFGMRNFTADFAHTKEFKRLMELGYLSLRYTERNNFGVRYEPWHIKVIS